MRERMRLAHELVAEQLKCAFVRNKTRYDARVKAIQFKAGDFVWFFSPRKKQGLSRKWQLMTSGPYKVVHRVNLVNYVIQKTPRSSPFICHIDRMRKFDGELPRCWSESATDRLPSVSTEQSEMTAENKLLPVASVQKIPTPNVPSRDSTSDCTDVTRPVRSDMGKAGRRRSLRHRRLPKRYCDALRSVSQSTLRQ